SSCAGDDSGNGETEFFDEADLVIGDASGLVGTRPAGAAETLAEAAGETDENFAETIRGAGGAGGESGFEFALEFADAFVGIPELLKAAPDFDPELPGASGIVRGETIAAMKAGHGEVPGAIEDFLFIAGSGFGEFVDAVKPIQHEAVVGEND